METGKLPNAKVEVVEFNREAKEELQLAVYFETQPLILLDAIEDKLLLSLPKVDDSDYTIQNYYTDTFFLQLTDEIYFSEYKLL